MMLNKSLTPHSDTRTILLIWTYEPRRMTIPIDAKNCSMDYRDHSYRNVNIGLFSNQVIEICLNLYVLENIGPKPFS
jgi:hypothetical protein